MKIIDTSVLVADLNPTDSLHAVARQMDFSNGHIHPLVFVETINVLERRVHSKEYVTKLAGHLQQQFIFDAFGWEIMPKALDIFLRYFGKISLTDAILAAEAKRQNATLVTLDQNLQEAARSEGILVERA